MEEVRTIPEVIEAELAVIVPSVALGAVIVLADTVPPTTTLPTTDWFPNTAKFVVVAPTKIAGPEIERLVPVALVNVIFEMVPLVTLAFVALKLVLVAF